MGQRNGVTSNGQVLFKGRRKDFPEQFPVEQCFRFHGCKIREEKQL